MSTAAWVFVFLETLAFAVAGVLPLYAYASWDAAGLVLYIVVRMAISATHICAFLLVRLSPAMRKDFPGVFVPALAMMRVFNLVSWGAVIGLATQSYLAPLGLRGAVYGFFVLDSVHIGYWTVNYYYNQRGRNTQTVD